MTASSYGSGMSTTRDVKILKDLDEDIRGKDVLIVEDIIWQYAVKSARNPQPA
jgi:hypoxanthine phosphoribosyltransferase